jgi:hypothetical protein
MQKFPRDLYPNLADLDQKVAKMLASKAAKEEWDVPKTETEICKIHPIYWMEEYGFIEEGKIEGDAEEVPIIPFRLNPVQLQIADAVAARLKGRLWERVQVLVLKHRKAGISTLFAAFDYWMMRFRGNTNVFLIADLSSHTSNIFRMVERFYKYDQCSGKPKKVTMPKGKSGLRLSNGSMLEMDSGENSNPGTSGTIQVCHMSENSKWRDPDSAETSLLNSIPRKGFAFIAKESTAYGMNKFAQDCDKAQERGSRWDFVFINWKDLPDCREPLLLNEKLEYTQEEKEIANAYDLTPEHIKFRRNQIDLLGGSTERFKQDFPLNPQEPFLVTGSFYFDSQRVKRRILDLKFFIDWKENDLDFVRKKYHGLVGLMSQHPDGLVASLRELEDRCVVPQTVTFSVNQGKVMCIRTSEGRLQDGCALRFKEPRKNNPYVLTIDVAEGKRTSEYVSDNSIIEVFDAHRRDQVMEWGGVFDEEMTAMYAVWIAQYYNNALIIPEMNNTCGGTLKAELEKTGYKRFYYRQKVSGQQVHREFGWETRQPQKKDVCGRLKLDFKNTDCLLHSLELLGEMLYFTEANGKLTASPGHRDDRVMATSLALKIIHDTPAFHDASRRRGEESKVLREFASVFTPTALGVVKSKSEAIRRYL